MKKLSQEEVDELMLSGLPTPEEQLEEDLDFETELQKIEEEIALNPPTLKDRAEYYYGKKYVEGKTEEEIKEMVAIMDEIEGMDSIALVDEKGVM